MSRTKRLLRGLGAASALSIGFGAVAVGCLNRPIDRLEPKTTSTVVERLQQNGVDKIDLLLAIDNSISMADKQAILAKAVPDLVNRLVTPICVDDEGVADPGGSVVDAEGKCGDGLKPEFPPIRNINVGIISSSLGDLTAGSCASAANPDDQAHLLKRGGTGEVTTYKDKGFLAWDPDNKRGGETDAGNLVANLGDLVVGVGQVGCGYEMQLESILRFLVDPEPYETLVGGNNLQKNGTDQVILQQRSDFLRADSLLAILILSDENDCSIDVGGQGFLTLKTTPFYKSTSECASDPNDACCTSCALIDDPDNAACDAGGSCTDGKNTKYTAADDHANLRCFNQKQRYGVNFLYPVQRYINAFTQITIDPNERDYSAPDPEKGVTSPLFQDLSADQTAVSIRSPDLVFVAGIVGVPWQAIARKDDSGNPDLKLGFKRASELTTEELDAMIGDPDANVPPTDPFMIESVSKRSGNSSLTGESLPGDNPINGNDFNVPAKDSLQFSCIFPLNTPVTTNSPDCNDCSGAECDNPLCDDTTQTTQINAKAFPGLRELAFLRGMGDQGIFASICPAKALDSQEDEIDYGYRPAVNAIIDRLKEELGGQCLAKTLKKDEATGLIPCLVLEASRVPGDCNCDAATGRVAIPETGEDGEANPKYNAVLAAQEDPFAPKEPNEWNCFCEITQLTGDELTTCENNADPAATSQGNGWCYIDATVGIGNPDLVAGCPPTERRLVRFVGEGEPVVGGTVFVTCSGES